MVVVDQGVAEVVESLSSKLRPWVVQTPVSTPPPQKKRKKAMAVSFVMRSPSSPGRVCKANSQVGPESLNSDISQGTGSLEAPFKSFECGEGWEVTTKVVPNGF
jgi:hypothetical protein